jgi:hypothetical protein
MRSPIRASRLALNPSFAADWTISDTAMISFPK